MRNTSLMIVALLLTACGGDAPESANDWPPTTSGDEGVQPYDDGMDDGMDDGIDEELVEEEPVPTGPGQIHAVIRMANEDRAGTIQVLSHEGATVAEGSAGETFSVPSGAYRVVGMLDESLLPGHGEQDEHVTVDAGETSEVTLTYEVARVRLNVRRNGRAISRWSITLTREGRDTEITMTPSREHVMMPPGRYSGVLNAGGRRIEVTGLIFQGGATMDVPVNVE